MAKRPATTEEYLHALAEGPSLVATATAGLADAQLQTRPTPEEWSANDVLAHMRSCADMWGKCIAEMLAHDKPTIRAINPTTWIQQTDYPQQAFRDSLHAFTTQRTELVATLKALTPEEWLRSATITGAGAPMERSVQFYARWLANHERPHLKQIASIAKMLQA